MIHEYKKWLARLLVVAGIFDVCYGRDYKGGLDHELLDASAYALAPAVLVDGNLYDVKATGFRGTVYLDDDVARPVPDGIELLLCKGERFADGTVEVVRGTVKPKTVAGESLRSSPFLATRMKLSGMQIELAVLPSRDYHDVQVAVLFFTDSGRQSVHLLPLVDLKSGQTLRAQFDTDFAYGDDKEFVNYAFLFFCSEGEIVTRERRELTPVLNHNFENWYQQLVYAYQSNSGLGVRPVSLVQRYPVEIGETVRLGGEIRKIFFRLKVDERGFVSSLATDADLQPALEKACRQSLQEWLFLPRLEDGFAVPSEVRVPIILSGD